MGTHDAIEIHAATPLGGLAALQWGPASAPPLLALHGWLDNAASFTRVAPLLATHHRVIALDLPGHGHSAHMLGCRHHYHLVDQVDHVLDFVTALDLERFDLLGHSLGAGIASLVAAAAPTRIRKLALIEGLGPLADDGSETLERWQTAHARREPSLRPLRTFGLIDAAVAARVAAGGLEADEARPIVARNLRPVDGGFGWCSDRQLRLRTSLRIGEAQVRRLLRGIAVPTLLLLAAPTTPYLPTALMNARTGCMACIRVQHITGPHHLHIRRPRAVADAIQAFLEAAPGRFPERQSQASNGSGVLTAPALRRG